MKEEILKLRALGMTYNQIKEATGASKSTISYYCSEGGREKTAARQRLLRENKVLTKMQIFRGRLGPHANKGINNKFTHFVQTDKTFVFTHKQIKEMLLDNPICYLSGRSLDLDDPQAYQFDHKIPASKGGDNSLENLGFATTEANRAKSDLLLEDFLDLCEDVLRHNGRIA